VVAVAATATTETRGHTAPEGRLDRTDEPMAAVGRLVRSG
jgi:hypothetical protein